jgi:hypothetical protein
MQWNRTGPNLTLFTKISVSPNLIMEIKCFKLEMIDNALMKVGEKYQGQMLLLEIYGSYPSWS